MLRVHLAAVAETTVRLSPRSSARRCGGVL
jgi:hypothetical protein